MWDEFAAVSIQASNRRVGECVHFTLLSHPLLHIFMKVFEAPFYYCKCCFLKEIANWYAVKFVAKEHRSDEVEAFISYFKFMCVGKLK